MSSANIVLPHEHACSFPDEYAVEGQHRGVRFRAVSKPIRFDFTLSTKRPLAVKTISDVPSLCYSRVILGSRLIRLLQLPSRRAKVHQHARQPSAPIPRLAHLQRCYRIASQLYSPFFRGIERGERSSEFVCLVMQITLSR